MSINRTPDIIVGIDLGQTCTGVAYNLPGHGTDNIRWIQKWPGRSNANENKVPTMLLYPKGQDKPYAWGFKAEAQSHLTPDDFDVREWFKTLLDPGHLARQSERFSVSHEDVRHWFRDYLTNLYEHIQAKLSTELSNFRWDFAYVEFLFSVPTTWSPAVVDQFKLIVSKSGYYGPEFSGHGVSISLTEPEASAVYTSTAAKGLFQEGDVLVVCDAGGGTTDLSALKVTDTAVGGLSLKQLKELDVVTGETIGSAAIDFEFEKLTRRRLKEAKMIAGLDIDPEHAAWVMAKSNEFANTKCEFGSLDFAPTFSIMVPGLPPGYSNPTFRIINREMLFTKEELGGLFDSQIEKLFSLIDAQLESLTQKLPQENVSHLILSGGLGQSQYVQQKLRNRYGEGSSRYTNAQAMHVRVAPDPQLSVCKGLVADRLRKLRVGEGVLGWRCCRASYGLLCKELYDKDNPNHFGRRTERDPRDDRLYCPDMIDWFVEKGTPVSLDTPMVHDFQRKLDPGDPRRVFPTKIVVSYNDKESLPCYFKAGVEKLCEVESDLSSVDDSRFKERNKRFWKPGKTYYEVCYQVQVIVGPADLRFELWFDGQKLSKDNSIKVEWAASTAPSAPILQSPPLGPSLIAQDGVLHRESGRWSSSRIRLNRMFSHTPPTTP